MDAFYFFSTFVLSAAIYPRVRAHGDPVLCRDRNLVELAVGVCRLEREHVLRLQLVEDPRNGGRNLGRLAYLLDVAARIGS